jgi:hypothetical protein
MNCSIMEAASQPYEVQRQALIARHAEARADIIIAKLQQQEKDLQNS